MPGFQFGLDGFVSRRYDMYSSRAMYHCDKRKRKGKHKDER